MSTQSYESTTTRPVDPLHHPHRLPIGTLLRSIGLEASVLYRSTIALLRKELSENTREAQSAFTWTLISSGVLGFGLLFTLAGLDFLLIQLLSPEILPFATAAWVCTLGIGVLFLIVGGIIFSTKSKKLRPERLVPSRTLETLERHADWAKSKTEEVFK